MTDTLNEEKEKLLLVREQYKQNLLEEVIDIKTEVLKTTNLVLVAGSIIVIGYVVVKTISGIFSLFGTKQEKIKEVREIVVEKPYQVYDSKSVEKESFMSPIISALKQEMRLFLLGIAKQALKDFLEKMQQKTKKDSIT
jgi:hypothetical protein